MKRLTLFLLALTLSACVTSGSHTLEPSVVTFDCDESYANCTAGIQTLPTATAQPTATPYPTYTPAPTYTPYPTWTPTATPQWVPESEFAQGAYFMCKSLQGSDSQQACNVAALQLEQLRASSPDDPWFRE